MMLEHLRHVRGAAHGHIEPYDRCPRRTDGRGGGWWRVRGQAGKRIHVGGQGLAGERQQHAMAVRVAHLGLVDHDRDPRGVRQHQLVDKMNAPVGRPDGGRACQLGPREHRELAAGSDAGELDASHGAAWTDGGGPQAPGNHAVR